MILKSASKSIVSFKMANNPYNPFCSDHNGSLGQDRFTPDDVKAMVPFSGDSL